MVFTERISLLHHCKVENNQNSNYQKLKTVCILVCVCMDCVFIYVHTYICVFIDVRVINQYFKAFQEA